MAAPINIPETVKRSREPGSASGTPTLPTGWQGTAEKIVLNVPCGSPPLKRFVAAAPGSPKGKERYTHETMDPDKYNYKFGEIILKRASGDAESKKS